MARPFATLLIAVVATVSGCGGDDDEDTTAKEGGPPSATAPATSEGDSGPEALKLKQIASLDAPTYVTSEPDNAKRLFVTEQAGTIKVIEDGETLEEPFLDLSAEVGAGGERGLLSIAFAPDYAKSRKFYVYFTDKGGDIRIQEYERSEDAPARADADSARELLRIEHSQFPNHNGGQLQFGPDDLLYIGTGDGGGAGNPLKTAQDKGSLLGKLLRIDPAESDGKPYGIPKDNPFVGEPGARGEVYAYGLRNPYRFSFDRKTGALAIGDVGQDEFEEVDFVERGKGRGADFGWSAFEGRESFGEGETADHVPPVIVRETRGADGDCSVIGGYVVRDPKLGKFQGRYLFGDFCVAALRQAKLAIPDAENDRALGLDVEQLSSFGQDSDGGVYAVSLSGPVYRFVAE